MPSTTAPALPPGRLNGFGQPTLVSETLLLRPWAMSDVDSVVEAYNDTTIQHWHARTMDMSEAVAWIESWEQHWTAENAAGWAVVVNGVVVGRTGLCTLNLREGWGEASYWTLPAFRGRGFATRSLHLMSGWLLDALGLHRIEIQHSTQNQASCRVAVNAGFIAEGTKRSAGLHADGWHDMHLHARLG